MNDFILLGPANKLLIIGAATLAGRRRTLVNVGPDPPEPDVDRPNPELYGLVDRSCEARDQVYGDCPPAFFYVTWRGRALTSVGLSPSDGAWGGVGGMIDVRSYKGEGVDT